MYFEKRKNAAPDIWLRKTTESSEAVVGHESFALSHIIAK